MKTMSVHLSLLMIVCCALAACHSTVSETDQTPRVRGVENVCKQLSAKERVRVQSAVGIRKAQYLRMGKTDSEIQTIFDAMTQDEFIALADELHIRVRDAVGMREQIMGIKNIERILKDHPVPDSQRMDAALLDYTSRLAITLKRDAVAVGNTMIALKPEEVRAIYDSFEITPDARLNAESFDAFEISYLNMVKARPDSEVKMIIDYLFAPVRERCNKEQSDRQKANEQFMQFFNRRSFDELLMMAKARAESENK